MATKSSRNSPLLLVLFVLFIAAPAQAQEVRYSLRLQQVPLDQALERLVALTRLDLMYDPALVRGLYATCYAEEQPAEALLRCLLTETGLDYYRLSSGTYVLIREAAARPQYGQLVGLVVDATTGEPLPYAHLLLAEARTGTAATRDGRFVLGPLLPGRYHLFATYLGYEDTRLTVHVPPDGTARVEVKLKAQPLGVKPVVVNGLLRLFPASELGREEVDMGTNGYAPPGLNDVRESVRTLPGVQVGGVLSDVHVQGGASGGHQFRLDDAPIFIPINIAGMIGPFSPFAIQRVTAHKAGFGTALGSHLSGVLIAEHDLGDGERPGLDVQADALAFNGRLTWRVGRENGLHAYGMVSLRNDLWGVYQPPAFASLLRTLVEPDTFLVRQFPDELQQSYEGNPFYLASQNPSLNFNDVHAAARVRFPGHHSLYLSFFHGRKSLSADLVAAPMPGMPEPNDTPAPNRDYYAWTNEVEQIRYERVIHPRLLGSLQFRRSRYELRHLLRDAEHFDLNPTTQDDGNRITEQALSLRLDYSVSRSLHAGFGADAARTTLRFFLGGDGIWSLLHNRTSDRLAVFLLTRYAPTPFTTLEVGTRLTHLITVHPENVFLEPRAEVRQDIPATGFGALAFRISGGLYRQYLNQFDLSSLQASPLRPSLRFWLPVDGSVRPSKAYHLAGDALWMPGKGWEVQAEAYHKWLPHELMFNYRVIQPPPAGPETPVPIDADQQLFLDGARGRAFGGAVAVKKQVASGHLSARYEYSYAVRHSTSRFRGRREPVPWNQPHRAEMAGFFTPLPRLSLQARAYGIWARPWGFAQVYYDYLEYRKNAFFPYLIGNPEAHRLPPLLQLDLAASYDLPLGPGRLQFRMDVLNATNRRNVAYWQLQARKAGMRPSGEPQYIHEAVPRYLLPRMVTFSARLSL